MQIERWISRKIYYSKMINKNINFSKVCRWIFNTMCINFTYKLYYHNVRNWLQFALDCDTVYIGFMVSVKIDISSKINGIQVHGLQQSLILSVFIKYFHMNRIMFGLNIYNNPQVDGKHTQNIMKSE